MRLLAQVDGKLIDLTHMDPVKAAPFLQRATAIFIAHQEQMETVAHYQGTGQPERWTKGHKATDPSGLPDGWDLPGGRLVRPGGKENPHAPAKGKQAEVKATWRLSTHRT